MRPRWQPGWHCSRCPGKASARVWEARRRCSGNRGWPHAGDAVAAARLLAPPTEAKPGAASRGYGRAGEPGHPQKLSMQPGAHPPYLHAASFLSLSRSFSCLACSSRALASDAAAVSACSCARRSSFRRPTGRIAHHQIPVVSRAPARAMDAARLAMARPPPRPYREFQAAGASRPLLLDGSSGSWSRLARGRSRRRRQRHHLGDGELGRLDELRLERPGDLGQACARATAGVRERQRVVLTVAPRS